MLVLTRLSGEAKKRGRMRTNEVTCSRNRGNGYVAGIGSALRPSVGSPCSTTLARGATTSLPALPSRFVSFAN